MKNTKIEALSKIFKDKEDNDTIIVTSKENISSIFDELDVNRGSCLGLFESEIKTNISKTLMINGQSLHLIESKDLPLFIEMYNEKVLNK